MTVSSYLELFTTLYGWLFYGILWDVLVGTGIAYLPFLGIILDNIIKPYTSQESKDASVTSLRRMEIDIFLAMCVVVLAAQPFIPLNAGILDYDPVPNALNYNPPQNQTATNNQSTFGTTGFSGAGNVQVSVPVMWYAAMGASAGINHAVISGFPTIADLRNYENAVRNASIRDPRLRQEFNQFYTECYVPARSKYVTERPQDAAVQAIINQWGNDDTEWVGSHVFLDTPGYYDSFRMSVPMEPYPYLPVRDTEYNPLPGEPAYTGPGRPYCNEWWRGTGVNSPSLKGALLQEFNLSTVASNMLATLNAGMTFSQERLDDNIIRVILMRGPATWSSNYYADQNVTIENKIGQSVEWFAKDLIGGVGTGVASIIQGTIVHVMLYALPMIQALLLLAVYALLPIVIVVSRYSLPVMMAVAIGIFTIKFWSVLWALAAWVDNNLIFSMYPNADAITKLWIPEHGGKRWLLDMLTTGLYVGLPMVFTGLMGWAGFSAARYIQGQVNAVSGPANQASNTAGQITVAAGKSIAGGAKGLVAKGKK